MGAFRDHFEADYEGHKIEFEAYSAGSFSYGCALFVDNERVDSVERYGILFSYFTLRNNIKSDDKTIKVRVEVRHTFGTSVKLFIDEKEVPFNRLR